MSKILIVGGGPVGAGLAVGLVHEKIPVHLIEKKASIPTFFKASTIHPPTLEILEEWGFIEKALKIGKRFDRIQYWNKATGQLIAEFHLDLLKEHTKYPFRLHFDQQFLTQFFFEYLSGQPLANVRFGTELVDIAQDKEKVRVRIKKSDGEIEEDEYDYVVAADGISSFVRDKIGIKFEGYPNPHYHVLMGINNYKIRSPYSKISGVAMFLHEKEWVDIIDTPEFLKVIVPSYTSLNMEDLTDQFIRTSIKETGLFEEGFDIIHRSVYQTYQLVAEKLAAGRVLLVGDAAHVNVEFGGMGMNSGLHDAYLLVRKFREVLNGRDHHKSFEEYSKIRLKINKEFVQKDTVRNRELIQNIGEYESILRQRAMDKELAVKHLLRTSMLEGYRTMLKEMEEVK